MANGDDDCDLDTLSALLEEDSNDSVSAKDAKQPGMVNEQDGTASEELDAEALCSMLDQDSDFDDTADPTISEGKDTEAVSAEAVASFLGESSDSESECVSEDKQSKQEDKRRQGNKGDHTRKVENCEKASTAQRQQDRDADCGVGVSNTHKDPQHVKTLQDELMMMQQRMMEIQQLLASQSSAAVPSSSQQSGGVETKDTQSLSNAVSQEALSSTSVASSSGSLSTGVNYVKKSSSPGESPSTLRSPSVLHSKVKHSSSHSTPSRQNTSRTGRSTPGDAASNSSSAVSKNGSSQSKHLRKKDKEQLPAKHADTLKHGKRQGTGDRKANCVNRSDKCSQDEANMEDHRGRKRPSSSFLADVASSSGEGGGERKDMKRALFGDDSDSDWEDMDGEKTSLSKEGQEIKKLLDQGARQRQAHTPSYSPSTSISFWKGKAEVLSSQRPGPTKSQPQPGQSAGLLTTSQGRPSLGSSTGPTTVKKETEDKDCITEKFSGLRIKNPKVSSIMLATKMEGRRMIAVSRLHLKVKSPELQSNWVTIGVMVNKSESRKSQTGKTYSIWKLSDLQDTDTTVSFFLFGQVYKQLWKMDVGTVIGILNPNIMDSMEKSSGEVAFTVNNAQQVMEIGQSRDLGWCIGKTKRGTTCTNFVNKKLGDFCTYHVQAAYRKQSAKRSELHGSCPGSAPKSSLKSKILQNGTFFYGGETFTSSQGKAGGGKKDKMTLAKLQSSVTQQDRRKVNTLAIQNLLPSDKEKVESKLSQQDQPFLNLLSVPSVGSMNLVRHMASAEGHSRGSTGIKGGSALFQSIRPADLIKQHRQQMEDRVNKKKQDLKATGNEGTSRRPQPGSSQVEDGFPHSRPVKQGAPVLGKGFYPGSNIDLAFGSPQSSNRHKPSSADAAKRKAISKVQATGGLEKTDPNAVRKPTPDVETVKKRVLENIENEKTKGESGGGTDSGQVSEPARKRSRLLGDVDPNSEEVKQLLKARSSHTGALAQAEADREERYFDGLEKKEMMEEKMQTVTSMGVTVFTCEQCKYTAMSLNDRCKQERHAVKKHKGKKRFFACKKCKHRTVSLQRYPTSACTNCGELTFEKTSMYKEKSGPKLESETLCLRGDEGKFINAMEQKVYMTTFEQV